RVREPVENHGLLGVIHPRIEKKIIEKLVVVGSHDWKLTRDFSLPKGPQDPGVVILPVAREGVTGRMKGDDQADEKKRGQTRKRPQLEPRFFRAPEGLAPLQASQKRHQNQRR